MKRRLIFIGLFLTCTGALFTTIFLNMQEAPAAVTKKKHCIFMTVMGEEPFDTTFGIRAPEKVQVSMDHALGWMAHAQQENGGWGAGSHYSQQERNPLAVKTDPATTSMVAMALLRSGSTLSKGPYSMELNKALNYILTAVENTGAEATNITTESNTQIQMKLGANIDVVLSSQFLSNIVDFTKHNPQLHARVKKDLDICVGKIQKAQAPDGSFKGGSWAGVLQSALANNALESAQSKGAHVDDKVLEKSRNYQKGNFNTSTGDVKTEAGAGIILYSVSGSSRASAKEARKVEEDYEQAKKDGKVSKNDKINTETLQKMGYSPAAAMNYSTSYEVYQSAKMKAQDDDVMNGFGNNGGEEFVSYLQTGESMIIGNDKAWKSWYEKTAAKLVSIQNQDGSWNGHHCITSPVFCTATCILILSVNNDVEKLVKMGAK